MGRIETFRLSIKPLQQNPRKVWVYLPDDYDAGDRIYPVLYMFDGHNLFKDSIATYGKCWGFMEYLGSNRIPLVVIGVDCNHIGDKRIDEYMPLQPQVKCWGDRFHAEGDITGKWFAEKLKPFCEKKYRIAKDRGNIGIGGSSMGGLMALYMISAYSDLFSKAACLSPTIDLDFMQLRNYIRMAKIDPDCRIYMDYGSNELQSKKRFVEVYENLLMLNHEFQEHGCNTFPHIVVGGSHCEASWETQLPVFLPYLYPNLG